MYVSIRQDGTADVYVIWNKNKVQTTTSSYINVSENHLLLFACPPAPPLPPSIYPPCRRHMVIHHLLGIRKLRKSSTMRS